MVLSNSLSKTLIVCACVVLAGCSQLLPRGTVEVKGVWHSFDEARASFEKIVPYQTRVKDLEAIGIVPRVTPNITVLNYSDVLQRFVPSPVIDPNDLDDPVRDCITAKTSCSGYEIDQRFVKRERVGNFWADFFGFKRETDVLGWRFKGLVLIKEDVIIYKLVSGEPIISEKELKSQPARTLPGCGRGGAAQHFLIMPQQTK
jgi:hypothetical protein